MLFDVYKQACTGGTTYKCAGNTIQWSNLLTADGNLYGTGSASYNRFRYTGQDFGVDH